MKDTQILKLQQADAALQAYRTLLTRPKPRGGWIRTIREALGMSSLQLAKKLGKKASQTIEDIQASEVTGTIKLNTLNELAEAMGCQLVYALVPKNSLEDVRHEEAKRIARKKMAVVAHTMRLEEQGLTKEAARREFDRLVKKLLDGNPKKLWE